MTMSYTATLPSPSLPYSPMRWAGDWAYVSGQLGVRDGELVEGFEAQARQVLENLHVLVYRNSVRLDQVVKVTVFLADMADYERFNEIYAEFFGDHKPARTVVGVSELPLGARIELEATAYLGPSRPAV